MTARRACAALAAAVALGGCGLSSNGAAVTMDDVAEAVERTAESPRAFAYVRTQGGTELAVRGVVDDDYRYRATVSRDGRDVLEEIVSDDARYVRLLDPAAVPKDVTPAVAAALRDGRWVVDGRGAAPDGVPVPATSGELLSPWTVLAQVRFLDRVPESLRRAGKRGVYDPDSAAFLEKFDKFPRHEADGLRYDGLPAAFDPDRAFREGLPADFEQLAPYFLYTSVWLRDDAVTRVELLFDIPDLREHVDRVQRIQVERTGQEYVPGADRPLIPAPYAVSYRVTPSVRGAVAVPRDALAGRLPRAEVAV